MVPRQRERLSCRDKSSEVPSIMSSEKTEGCGRKRKRKRQSPKGRGAIFLCNPNLLSVPKCAASKWSGCLPVPAALCWQRSTARTPSHSTEDISLAASSSRSLSFILLTRTLNMMCTLSHSPSHYATVACLYLLCKVRCKVLQCFSFL